MEKRKVGVLKVLKAMMEDWYDRRNNIVIPSIQESIFTVCGAVIAVCISSHMFGSKISAITIVMLVLGAVIGFLIMPICYMIYRFIVFCNKKIQIFKVNYYDKKNELLQKQ